MASFVAKKTKNVIDWRHAWIVLMASLVSVVLAVAAPAQTTQARFVTWDALVPAAEQTDALGITSGFSSAPEPAQTHAPLSPNDDFDPLARGWQTALRPDAGSYSTATDVLDKPVLLDGYVLPLAWEGARVVNFLLVPWVGACIHMPTPPPNQIIQVSYPEGIALEKQFQAVRLSGVLKSEPAEHDLFLVDGQRSIPVSYALEDAAVTGSPGKVIAMSASDLPVLAKLQLWVSALFTDSMLAISQDGSSQALILALLISFGYGALHTLGPGHGKSVVISYFVGTGGSLRRGLTMGVRIAVIHVISAIVVVFLFDLAVRQTSGTSPAEFRAIRLGSYALIIGIGGIMLWQAVAALLARREAVAALGHAHGHTVEHVHTGHHAHPHAAHHHHGHSGCSACAAAARQTQGGWIAASVGIVPCTGALLVMLFGLANDLVLSAVLMVVAISVGMAVSMAIIGLIALYGRRVAEKRFAGDPGRRANFDIGARIVGSGCVLVIGTLLFVLTLSYPVVLQPPLHDLSDSRAANSMVPG